MKKIFNLWCNIVVICLCFCAIAVGVFSAQQASLKVSGSIGFSAHNCDVWVYGSIRGAVDGNNQPLNIPEYGSVTAYKNVHNDKSSWAIGSVYFDDRGEFDAGKNAVDIKITLKMYNSSVFDVLAKFNENFISDCGLSSKVSATINQSQILLASNQTKANAQTMVITLSLAVSESFTSAISFSAKNLVTFEKYEKQQYYISADNKLMTKMGHGTEKDQATNVELEWYAFAVLGEGSTYTKPSFANNYYITMSSTNEKWYSLTNSVMTLENAKGHTFWFVQRYVTSGGYSVGTTLIEGVKFNSSTTNGNIYANDNIKSDIYNYINGDYLTQTGIDDDLFFSKISERTVNETSMSFKSKLWLISLEELSLFPCATIDISDTNNNVATKGINPDSGNANYWLRTIGESMAFTSPVYVATSYGAGANYECTSNYYGIRASFQISIS